MLRELLAHVGTDRFLTQEELAESTRWVLADAWKIYASEFMGFAGSRTDAQFARLRHPAETCARPRVSPGTTIVIAGTGPSLAARVDELRRLRKRISIWTSIRGAEALTAYALSPDLVIVQHATDLDGYLTLRHLRDRDGASPLVTAPVVLAEPKTPAALLAAVSRERLAAFDPALGWGLWPATLAWLACGAGARSVALAGIDLGSREHPDPSQQPLRALLALIAEGSSVATVDAGTGAIKAGWMPRVLDDTVGPIGASQVELDGQAPWSVDERRASLEATLAQLNDHLDAAEMFRARALRSRIERTRADDGPLGEAWSIVLGWRESAPLRAAFQEDLGVTFLPRFWRHPVESVAGPLWRPILLATDELVRQRRAAEAALALEAAA